MSVRKGPPSPCGHSPELQCSFWRVNWGLDQAFLIPQPSPLCSKIPAQLYLTALHSAFGSQRKGTLHESKILLKENLWLVSLTTSKPSHLIDQRPPSHHSHSLSVLECWCLSSSRCNCPKASSPHCPWRSRSLPSKENVHSEVGPGLQSPEISLWMWKDSQKGDEDLNHLWVPQTSERIN